MHCDTTLSSSEVYVLVLDDLYKYNILEVALTDPAAKSDQPPDDIDERYDGLVDHTAPWSEWKRANFAMLRRIRPSKTAAVVATVRNEGIYLVEWIAHCRAIGFERIFLYTNDNTDGSSGLLQLLHRQGVIRLIENRFVPGLHPQIKAFEHSLHFLHELRDYEWVAYLDADEFLIPHADAGHTVGGLIAALRERYPAQTPLAICLNWFWMPSDGIIERQAGLIHEIFQTGFFHSHVKSIVHLASVSTMWAVHIPDPARNWCVNGNLDPIYMGGVDTDPRFHYARINHYYNKSFEEYAFKIERSQAGGPSFAGKSYEMFFLMDRAPSIVSWPIPEGISLRTKAEIGVLMDLPGIGEAVAEVERCFRERSRAIFVEGVDAAYRQAREIFERAITAGA